MRSKSPSVNHFGGTTVGGAFSFLVFEGVAAGHVWFLSYNVEGRTE
jgi:hypothetical protein